MSPTLPLFLLLVVVPAVAALIDCLAKDRHDVRRLPQGAWILVILLLAPLGAIAWFAVGRPRQRQVEPEASTPPPLGWEPAIGWEPPADPPDSHGLPDRHGPSDSHGLPAAYEPPPPGADPPPREPR